ncbi:ABC transporter substrate-binding protein [Henriciella sp. AS95]|uniref:MlaC/ttg2D family ABC transporter substrate-binding protein n=1 Tax=Henriciella sp. AS95 TaxID=3135782 RepID=UPI00316FE77F
MTEVKKSTIAKLTATLMAGAMSLGVVAPAAFAAEDNSGAVKVVDEASARTIDALQDQEVSDAEADSILQLVALDRVAQFALGNTWADLTDTQKADYVAAFEIYAKNQLKTHLGGFSGGEVKVTDVAERGDRDAIVSTQVTPEGEMPQTISWRVIEDGDWSVVDIQVQDVWFAIEQRAQFEAILDSNNGDIDGLISELKN